MDFSDSAEIAEFRSGLRAWLVDHTITPEADESEAMFLKRWHQVLFRGGWVGLSWPTEYGGKGLSNAYDVVLNEEIGASGAPDAPRIGYMGRAFLQWGTEEQRERFLPAAAERRRLLVPGLQRAQRGIRPRQPVDPRGQRTASTTASPVRRSGRAMPSTPTTASCWPARESRAAVTKACRRSSCR